MRKHSNHSNLVQRLKCTKSYPFTNSEFPKLVRGGIPPSPKDFRDPGHALGLRQKTWKFNLSPLYIGGPTHHKFNMPKYVFKPLYSAQTNKHGNVIVCKGTLQRKTYKIIKVGTYDDCNQCKAWTRSRRIRGY